MTKAPYPDSPIANCKRSRPNDDDEEAINQEEINAIVSTLGNQLLIVKKSIMIEKGTIPPLETLHLLTFNRIVYTVCCRHLFTP